MTRRLAGLALLLYPLAFRRRYGRGDARAGRAGAGGDDLRCSICSGRSGLPTRGHRARWRALVEDGRSYSREFERRAGLLGRVRGGGIRFLQDDGGRAVLDGGPRPSPAGSRAYLHPGPRDRRIAGSVRGGAATHRWCNCSSTARAGSPAPDGLSRCSRSYCLQRSPGCWWSWPTPTIQSALYRCGWHRVHRVDARGTGCGAVCVLASRASLFAVALSRGRLAPALACGTVVTAAMVTMALATTLYAIGLTADVSQLAGAPNGPLQALSTGASLFGQAMVMILAAMLATATTRRGWRVAGSRPS